MDFLGFRLYLDWQRLTRQSRQRFTRKWRAYEHRFAEGKMSEPELQQRVTARLAFIKKADTSGFRQKLFYTDSCLTLGH